MTGNGYGLFRTSWDYSVKFYMAARLGLNMKAKLLKDADYFIA